MKIKPNGKTTKKYLSSSDIIDYATIFVIALIALYNVLHIVRLAELRGLPLIDFEARWKENAYFLKGINPYTVSKENAEPSIGVIGDNMITAPWVWLIGTIFNPGFLPYSIARVYGVFAIIVLLICACICTYKYFSQEIRRYSNIKAAALALTIVTSLYWWYALYCGNNGTIAACLVIIGMCIYKNHPLLAGMAFFFAMVKPQLTVPFLLVIFIEKCYVTFVTTAGLGIFSMLLVSIRLKAAPWKLIFQTTSKSNVLSDTYIGVFDLMRYKGMSLQNTLVLDVIVGVIFLLCMLWILKKKNIDNAVYIFAVAAVMQSMWFYKQSHDNIVICILQMMSMMLIFDNTRVLRKIIGLICVLLSIGTFYISNLIEVIGVASPGTMITRSIYRTIEIFIYFAILVIITIIDDNQNTDREYPLAQ